MAVMRTRASRRGLAAIETAIVLPLILILTMGLLEYGWMFLKAQQIQNAAREGARVGCRVGATGADIISAVRHSMSLSGMDDSGYDLDRELSVVAGLEVGPMLTITVRVDYSAIGLGIRLIPTPATLEASVTMAREGP